MSPTDIAIIGLACRFPAAAGPRDFWQVLRDGREVAQLPGDIAEFDADFFNLSPREASAMDPRQRLALELAWELFEDAFLIPETQRGELVSVFLGAMGDDYALLTLRDAEDNVNHHSFAGISRGMIANRISYAFGLQGTSMTVDSGQSSSLVAVHQACESLRAGASRLAIAGGIQLNLAPETAALETEFGALSPSGHTYAFDARADGYVRGEGGALVLLQPLRAALEDGNRVRAVIRGSAVGNAGHSSAAQTIPSVAGQADVIRCALANAGLTRADIDYVEAHGTGTEIGDPIEARALGDIFCGRGDRPVRLGSVKTNIGHTGSAAGIAGLLKTVLALENAAIPPSLNYVSSGPDTDLAALGLEVNTALTPWPAGGHPRRAGVSSFGMGGTNAHVIVEQSPRPAEAAAAEHVSPTPVAWVLSARSEPALAQQAERLRAHLAAEDGIDVADVAWSLATTRSALEHRAVLVGDDRDSLTAQLVALAAGTAMAGRSRPTGKTAFVFPGQGAQWPGMGAQLYERFPVFANAFDGAALALDGRLRLPLKDVIWGDKPDLLENTEFAQPALFVIEVALAALLRDWGMVPDVVLGHSVGEIVAAHVAGVLTLDDAATVVVARSRLMAGLPAGGVMIAVAAGEQDVAALLTDGVAIAAVNGPNSVVISGAEGPATEVANLLAQRGAKVHRLAVSHAFHSPLMDTITDDLAALVAGVTPREARITLISNMSGQPADAGYGTGRYWVEHVRQPVRLIDGVRSAESLGAEVFVEVGPAAGLTAAVEQSLRADRGAAIATLTKDEPEVGALFASAGRAFTIGLDVNWPAALTGLRARRVELPTYGFARRRYWLGASANAAGPVISRSAGLAEQLQTLSRDEQRRQLVELICVHSAAVLGHSSGRDVDADRAFQDLGFESLTGVELRNRLRTETGLALSRTLIFDFPTPTVLADHLREKLLHADREESDEDKIWTTLRKIPLHELRRTGLLDKLLLLAGEPEELPANSTVSDELIDSLSADALIAMALDDDEAGGAG
ncbi:type I polyketide synthase [Mycobacterium rhizamassiliense]|uniref:type I polyketide synthase n=1 Tax=Mycobacterium rhizamassiliense TaxID=1841860 RepID=UPI00097D49B8|nr:type I polyketide synthase [Mycobacterium rhizamassiliense]